MSRGTICHGCFEDLYKTNLEALIGYDVSEDYVYLSNKFSYFEEALTSFKFEDFDKSFGSTILIMLPKIFCLLILENLYLWDY